VVFVFLVVTCFANHDYPLTSIYYPLEPTCNHFFSVFLGLSTEFIA
jgi:hypothetical protein